MSRRILAIAVAIVLAALGTIGGLVLVLSAESRAQNRISDPVTVAVATVRIPAGTSGEQVRTDDMVRLVRMPRSSVPDDFLPEISVEFDTLVITSTIAPGQLLLRANFGSSAAVTSGLALPAGMIAVTVETGAPEQVAGYVQAGAQVAIFVTYSVIDSNGTTTNIQRTRVLLPQVEVLAAGNYEQTRGGAEELSGSLLLTVAVTPGDAERLIGALNAGTLYLALLSEEVDVTPGPGVVNTDDGGGTSLFD